MVTRKSRRYFQSTICSWKWKRSYSLYANQVTCSPGPWAWIHPPWHMNNCFCHLFVSSELHSLMYVLGWVCLARLLNVSWENYEGERNFIPGMDKRDRCCVLAPVESEAGREMDRRERFLLSLPRLVQPWPLEVGAISHAIHRLFKQANPKCRFNPDSCLGSSF